MNSSVSRSRVRQHTRGRPRDRNKRNSRRRRNLRSRLRYSSDGDSRNSSSDERRNPRSSLRVRDRCDSHSTEVRPSRSRIRRHSGSRIRRRNRSRSNTSDMSWSPSRSRKRRTTVKRKATPRLSTPVLSSAPKRLRSLGSCGSSEASILAHALIQAIKTIKTTKSQNYYVSNFDPAIHNIEVWCEEVDRAKDANNWSDHECLARVASCLMGDAKVWLSEWVTNDRTWSNFKREFKSLCHSKLNYANILFDAMNMTSNKYPTFAEYARRTLLRLKIVQGLSDELKTLIVIRGIDSPQVRAAAENADLTPNTIVSFLTIYTKAAPQDN